MKSSRITFLFALLLSFSTIAQFGKYETKQTKNGKFQFINTETQEALFNNCTSINPITGDFSQTNDLYKRFILIEKKSNIYLFDTKQDKTIETINCDSLSFHEIPDWWSTNEMKSNVKKKVIQGKTHSKRKKYNTLTFLINVETAETRGFYPDELNVKYDINRKVLLYGVSYYYLLRNENFENLFSTLGNLKQYENGYFSGENKSREYGVLNHNAEEVIPFKYQQIRHIKDNVFSAVDNYGKVGIIKEGNQTVIPFEYDCFDESYGSCNIHLKSLENGFYLMKKENQLTVIDSLNQVIIPTGKYIQITHFKDSLLWIKCQDKLWGAYDMKNKRELIPCNYDRMNHYGNHLIVERNKKLGFLKLQNGEPLTPLIYDAPFTEVKTDSKVYFILETEGRKGVFSNEGKEIIPCIYDDISYENNFLLIKYKGLYGLFDVSSFQEILPIEFSKIDAYRLHIEKYEKAKIIKGTFTKEGKIHWYD